MNKGDDQNLEELSTSDEENGTLVLRGRQVAIRSGRGRQVAVRSGRGRHVARRGRGGRQVPAVSSGRVSGGSGSHVPLYDFKTNYEIVRLINDSEASIDPVRLAIETIVQIWEGRMVEWYPKSLELLLFVHQSYPSIQPMKIKKLMSNLKMKIAVMLFLEGSNEEYSQFVTDNFPGEGNKRIRDRLLSLSSFTDASELVFSEEAEKELMNTRISLIRYFARVTNEIISALH